MKAGGEQDGCCDLRLEVGGRRSLHAFPPWLSSVEALTSGTGGWLDPGVAKGLALPGEPAHLPLPWGIVLSALGALFPPLASSDSVVWGLGRAFIRRPRLGRSLLRGSVFRPFSWSVRRVTLTAESCKMWVTAPASGVVIRVRGDIWGPLPPRLALSRGTGQARSDSGSSSAASRDVAGRCLRRAGRARGEPRLRRSTATASFWASVVLTV